VTQEGDWVLRFNAEGPAGLIARKPPGHCCHQWNRLVDQPWLIMSIGLRKWAHGS